MPPQMYAAICRLVERRWIILIPLVIYLGLAVGRIATNVPWCDEAWFASSAVNLVRKGFMGNTLLADETDFPRIHQYTYWLPPMYFVTEALTFGLAGVGLLQARFISLIWGLASLLAVRSLSGRFFGGSRALTFLSVMLVGTNFFYLESASDGRMDMMAASLSLIGFSVYLSLRTSNLPKAVLLGNVFVCLSGLTHPNGLLGLLVLLFMMIYLDRHRLTFRMLLVALLPYALGAAVWGIYIAQDFEAFRDQLLLNTLGKEQENVFASGPRLTSIYYEIVTRYLKSHGFLAVDSIIKRAPAPILLFFFLCLFGYPFLAKGKDRLLWGMLVIIFLGLMFLVGNKTSTYLVWITPFFLMNAIAVWEHVKKSRYVNALFVLAFGYVLLFSLASNAYTIARNDYGNEYLPDLRTFNSTYYKGGLILGGAEIAFFYDFNDEVVQDDNRLGFRTVIRPDYLAISPGYRANFERYKKSEPEAWAHINATLSEDHDMVFKGRAYTFYRKKT
jgi:4-amino-4-deoxy-L-arabinose transferase-like glycosyltransferase